MYSKRDSENKEPVSLISIQSREVEVVICNSGHLDKYDLSGKSWKGFPKRKSCLTNIRQLFEGIKKHVDKGDLIDLGFTKGFQQIPSPKAFKKTKQPYHNVA